MSARATIALVVLLVSSRAAGATGPCPAGADPASGPLAGGTGPADFGAVPEACVATDAVLRVRGALLIASTMPDYYGRIIAAGTLRARYQLGAASALSFAGDVVNYRYYNSGGLTWHGASVGPATIGFHQSFALGSGTASSLYARVLLPLDSARQNGIETGLELGGTLRAAAGSRFVIDGGLALAAPLDVAGGQAHARLEPIGLAEAWLRLGRRVALSAGVSARVTAAPDFDLRTLVPRVGARFGLGRRFWTAALLEIPVAGSDRTDLIAGLYAGFTPG